MVRRHQKQCRNPERPTKWDDVSLKDTTRISSANRGVPSCLGRLNVQNRKRDKVDPTKYRFTRNDSSIQALLRRAACLAWEAVDHVAQVVECRNSMSRYSLRLWYRLAVKEAKISRHVSPKASTRLSQHARLFLKTLRAFEVFGPVEVKTLRPHSLLPFSWD